MNVCMIIILIKFINYATSRDFYVGMFKKNDFLVAQDRLYKERLPFRSAYTKYGRLFKCPITYFRVVDRLGIGRGPRVEIIRGGLGKKYLVLRIISQYNQPISVNIYVGCSSVKITRPPHRKVTTSEEEDDREENASDGDNNGVTSPKSDITTASANGKDGKKADSKETTALPKTTTVNAETTAASKDGSPTATQVPNTTK